MKYKVRGPNRESSKIPFVSKEVLLGETYGSLLWKGTYEYVRIPERNGTREKVRQLIIGFNVKVKCLDIKVKKQ